MSRTLSGAGSDSAPAAPPMYYAELPARPELQPWIAAHWHFRVAPEAGEIEHTVPLTGGALVHVHNRFPDTPMLTGPRVTPLRVTVRGGDEFWGTHLWPGAAASLLCVEAAAVRDAVVPAMEVLPSSWTEDLAERLAQIPDETELEERERLAAGRLDEAWAERAEGAAPLDRQVMQAVFLLLRSRGEEPVARLAAAVGLSPRHFRRRFRVAVGLTPKELARLRRVRSSAAGMVRGGPNAETWVGLAADHGYADQSHLVREYRSLLGLTPTGFRRHVRRIEHGEILS